MSCPNPSAHPVGVRHQGDRPLVLNGRRRIGAAISAVLLACRDRLRAVARRRRPNPTIDEVADPGRPPLPPGRAGPGALQRRQGRARRAPQGPRARSQADQDRQDDRLTTVREQVQDSIVSQYEGTSLSAVGQAVVSEDPAPFLSQLTTMSAYNDIQDQLFADYATELKALDIRRSATGDRRARWPRSRSSCAKEKADGRRRSSPRPRTSSPTLKDEERERAARLPQRRRPAAVRRAGLRPRRRRRAVRAGPGRRRLRLRRRRARAPSTAPA